jgi:hypothetical protein
MIRTCEIKLNIKDIYHFCIFFEGLSINKVANLKETKRATFTSENF